MNMYSPVRLSLLVWGVWLLTTRDLWAYVDPGTGSYLFQLLIAGLTALVFFFSSLKRKLARLWQGIFGGGQDQFGSDH